MCEWVPGTPSEGAGSSKNGSPRTRNSTTNTTMQLVGICLNFCFTKLKLLELGYMSKHTVSILENLQSLSTPFLSLFPVSSLSQAASPFPTAGTHVPANQQAHHPHPVSWDVVPNATSSRGSTAPGIGLHGKGPKPPFVRSLFGVTLRSNLHRQCV